MAVHVINNFADYKHFLKKKAKVAVYFKARWCGRCLYMTAKFEKLSQKYPGITFISVDVDDNSDIAQSEGIKAPPAFLFFHNGQKIDQFLGPDPSGLEKRVRKLDAC